MSTGLIRSFAFLVAVPVCALGADYAGSPACASCHADLFRSFMRTPMAHSSGRAGTAEPKERFDSAAFRDSRGAYTYTTGREGASYYFDFRQQGASQPVEGRRTLEYFVGSGHAARSYLLNVDGFLYEAPVAYYTNTGSWNAAPGYASYPYPYLTGPFCRVACNAMPAGFSGLLERKTHTPQPHSGKAHRQLIDQSTLTR